MNAAAFLNPNISSFKYRHLPISVVDARLIVDADENSESESLTLPMQTVIVTNSSKYSLPTTSLNGTTGLSQARSPTGSHIPSSQVQAQGLCFSYSFIVLIPNSCIALLVVVYLLLFLFHSFSICYETSGYELLLCYLVLLSKLCVILGFLHAWTITFCPYIGAWCWFLQSCHLSLFLVCHHLPHLPTFCSCVPTML